MEIFGSEDPTQERVLVVSCRPGSDAQVASLEARRSRPTRASAGVWSWTVRDIAGRTPFDGGVWEGDYFPAVCYGTAADWQDVLSTTRRRPRGRIDRRPGG